MKLIKSLLCAVALITSAAASAHPVWIVPSDFTLSSEDGDWVSVDVSATHTYFSYDKPVPLDFARVYSPDGDQKPVISYFKAQRRSVFDWFVNQHGTYRIEMSRPPFFFTSYKSGKRETPKRMMANKMQAKQRLPKNARDVKTLLIRSKSLVYITHNTPSDTVVTPKGKGLELNLKNHPNDLVVGEPVVFETWLNGKTVAGVKVEVTPEGTKYRDDRGIQEFVTDQTGRVEFNPGKPGRWFVSAMFTSETETPMADENMDLIYLVLEVTPQ